MRSDEMRRRSHLRCRGAVSAVIRQPLLLAILLLFGSPVLAADWYASPSGNNGNSCASAAAPCKTIQAAINKAAANDTVRVAQGNYPFVAPGIEINKAGLTLVGDNTPFAVDPHGAPGTTGNLASNASVLKQASGGASSSQRMIWVNNVHDVTIRNLYLETHLGRTREAIVAIGDIDGLLLDNNYIKFTGGTGGFGISINGAFSGAGSSSSVPASFPRMAGGFVTIRDNVLEPTLGGWFSTYVPKRAILFEKSLGLIQGNQMASSTVDLWTLSTSGTEATAVSDRHLTIDGNWFFGRLQNQINPVSGTATALNITNNHYVTPGSSYSPVSISGLDPATTTSSESHLLRLSSNQSAPTLVEGNEFLGFTNQYRALWLQSRRNVTVRGNTFTPEPNAGDFTAITIGNRVVQTGTPSNPVKFGELNIVGNSFLGSGATNKGKAVLFLDDNDKGGLANGDTPFVATIGGAGAADANNFDTSIRWYIAIDDRSCTALNHNSGGACNGTLSYAIGEGLSYSGGANTASEKRPFIWDVSAPGNSFGGAPMAGMNQAQFNVIWAKTFERHLSTLAPTTLGQVDYDWTPVITVGTVVFSPTAFTYDGLVHTISATLQEDPSATCVVTPTTVTNAGSSSVAAVCTSPGYNVSGNGTVSVAKAAGTVQLAGTSFTYTGNPHVLAPSMLEEAGATCTATPSSVANAGTQSVAISCAGTNYDASGSINVTVAKATGTLQLAETSFTYTGNPHVLVPSMLEEAGATCTATPSSVTNVGTQSVAISCTGTNYDASGSINVTVAKATGTVQLAETSFTYTGNPHVLVPSMPEEAGATCTATPSSVINAGTHSIGINCTGTNYNASGSIDVTVAKAAGTVQLAETTFTYTGSAHTLSASMQEESGATCSATPTSVTDAGTHSITISCTGTNFNASGSIDVTVAKAAGTVQLAETTFTYTGSGHALSASMQEESGAMCLATPSSVTDAGTHSIAINCTGTNYNASGSIDVTVDKAVGTVTFGPTSFTFDGTTHTTTAVIAEESGNATVCDLTYDPQVPLHAGTSSVDASCDGSNYMASATASMTVDPAPLVFTLSGTGMFVYDGYDHPASVSISGEVAGFPASTTISYNGVASLPNNVGNYAVVAALAPGVADYTATDATGQIEITAATASVSINNLLQTFDGQPKPVSTNTNPVGLDVDVTYDSEITPPTAVGAYEVIATITDSNYSGTASATLEIVAAAAPDLAVSLDVDRNYAPFGSAIIYTITVSNIGNRDVVGATVTDLLPVELDVVNASWSCIAGTGASCGASGSGDLVDTASIPLGISVTYLLAADVLDPSPASELVVNTVSVNVAGDVDANNDQASLNVQIVLFRDGFEIPEP